MIYQELERAREPRRLRPAEAASRLLFSDSARPLRFAAVGACAGAFQLALFAVLVRRGVNPLAGNAIAFLVAVQVNFLLSSTFTWGSAGGKAGTSLFRRWATFHAACTGTALLNFLVFAAVRHFIPDIVASGIGIAAAATLNYLANDRLVFAVRPLLLGRAK